MARRQARPADELRIVKRIYRIVISDTKGVNPDPAEKPAAV